MRLIQSCNKAPFVSTFNIFVWKYFLMFWLDPTENEWPRKTISDFRQLPIIVLQLSTVVRSANSGRGHVASDGGPMNFDGGPVAFWRIFFGQLKIFLFGHNFLSYQTPKNKKKVFQKHILFLFLNFINKITDVVWYV